MKTYLEQNSDWNDAVKTIRLLYKRLLSRGYSKIQLRHLFMTAAEKLSCKDMSVKVKKEDRKANKAKSQQQFQQVFFHLPFHPNDISRREIQRIYTQTCERHSRSFQNVINNETGCRMTIPGITIAYSRPVNLRDRLNPTILFENDKILVDMFAKPTVQVQR